MAKRKMTNELEQIEKQVVKSDQGIRTFFNVYSKRRGYICSCPNEDATNKALQDLFYENERFWRRARSEGKKSRDFDCFALASTDGKDRLIELMFNEEEDDEEEFEDVINQQETAK